MHIIIKVAFAICLAGATFPFTALAEDSLSLRITRVLSAVQGHEQQTDLDTPWAIMHGIIAFGKSAKVFVPGQRRPENSINYLLQTAHYAGKRIFNDLQGYPALITAPKNPNLTVCQRYYQVQDHPDQYLMAFAESGVGLDEKILIEGTIFSVKDLLDASLLHFDPVKELGWSITAYATYLAKGQRWQTKAGVSYGLEDLLKLAITQDPVTLTDGGTHHLFGVAKVFNRLQSSLPLGLRQDTDLYLRGYAMRSERFQQEDGAFSGRLLAKKTSPKTPRELVNSTGHILEWLAAFLSSEELKQPWITKAVERLCKEFEDHPIDSFNTSGMYHAANALKIYQQKIKVGSLQ